jgi:hypothetical protein
MQSTNPSKNLQYINTIAKTAANGMCAHLSLKEETKMKIVGYSNRTFEIRTNPHDGIFVEILPETQDEKALFGEGALKIYERSVNYVADRSIPWDGGENSGWRLLVEYLGGGDVFWERVREKHEEYKREAKQKRKELARKMAIFFVPYFSNP